MTRILVLFFAACSGGTAPEQADEPVSEGTLHEAGEHDNPEMLLFTDACDGQGNPMDDTSTRHARASGHDLVLLPCERFAYQVQYDVFLHKHGEPSHKVGSFTGLGSVSDDRSTFTNINKARGLGDCGTWEKYSVSDTALTLVERREQLCSEGSPSQMDPAAWPLATGPTVCDAADTVFFDCSVRGGKRAALCGSADGSRLTYTFGPPGSPELTASSADVTFGAGSESYARAQLQHVSFETAGHRYTLVDKLGSGAMDEGSMNNFTGVLVHKDGEELARLPCTDGAAHFASLVGSLQSMGYVD